MERKRSIGVRVICIVMLIPIVSVIFYGIAAILSLNIPNETKLEVMQKRNLKNLNITSIEEYDKFFKKQQSRMSHPLTILNAVILLILILGLWNLKEWSRVGFILYSVLNGIFIMVALFLNLSYRNRLTDIFCLVIFAILIYYLIHPKVKEQFK